MLVKSLLVPVGMACNRAVCNQLQKASSLTANDESYHQAIAA